MENKSSYRQIFKATSIFGGVQVIKIIISIIRSKTIAILLGPSGMGVAGLLISSLEMIQRITSMGLGISAVKDISASYAENKPEKIGRTITVVRKWIWITGAFGMLVVILLSPKLSEWSFGNNSYSWSFLIISITLLINQLGVGQSVLLRGMRQIKYLAKASILSSIIGLIFTVPLYYVMGIDGIVPGILMTSITGFLIMWFFASKLDYPEIKLNFKESWKEGSGMVRMGFFIGVSGTLAGIVAYLIRIFISQNGSISDVGLYTAGFAIINTYVEMVFTAMSTDYYPRLAASFKNKSQFHDIINHQGLVAILILAPLLIIFMVFINWIIPLVYSNEFLKVETMLRWASIGIIFKTASWPLGFVFLATGDSKTFLIKQIITQLIMLGSSVFFYSEFGLDGLGYAFLFTYILNFLILAFMIKFIYNFLYSKDYLVIFSCQLVLSLVVLYLVILYSSHSLYAGIILIFLSIFLSLKELNERLGLKWLRGK